MLHGDIIQLTQQALWFVLLLSAPPIVVAAVVGLLIAFIQAATQLHESTLSFVPKIVAGVVVLLVAGPWMITTLVEYLRRMLQAIPSMVG